MAKTCWTREQLQGSRREWWQRQQEDNANYCHLHPARPTGWSRPAGTSPAKLAPGEVGSVYSPRRRRSRRGDSPPVPGWPTPHPGAVSCHSQPAAQQQLPMTGASPGPRRTHRDPAPSRPPGWPAAGARSAASGAAAPEAQASRHGRGPHPSALASPRRSATSRRASARPRELLNRKAMGTIPAPWCLACSASALPSPPP